MNIEVTSASRKEQRTGDVAAAVFVITHDDIRRSGMTTIPDLLRLAPGVDVAQINANKWAVSVRGFNGLYANKLLVLVDGRSVYNRIFSGVFWDAEDLMLDDIERIEVIRGPGAAHLGRQRRQRRDQHRHQERPPTRRAGWSASTAGASGEQGAVRYGGHRRRDAATASISQWTGADQSLLAPGTRADDESHSVTTGFRADWTTQPGRVDAGRRRHGGPVARAVAQPRSADGGRRAARERPVGFAGRPSPRPLDAHARERRVAAGPVVRRHREPAGAGRRLRPHTFDVDTQYHTALGARQDLVAGAGYRFVGEQYSTAASASR